MQTSYYVPPGAPASNNTAATPGPRPATGIISLIYIEGPEVTHGLRHRRGSPAGLRTMIFHGLRWTPCGAPHSAGGCPEHRVRRWPYDAARCDMCRTIRRVVAHRGPNPQLANGRLSRRRVPAAAAPCVGPTGYSRGPFVSIGARRSGPPSHL